MSIFRERKKASKNGTLDVSLPATLRRRAEDLFREDGFNQGFLKPLLEAADRVEVYERALKEGVADQVIIGLVSDNRRLRKAVATFLGQLRTMPVEKGIKRDLQARLDGALRATAEFGGDIRIMAITLGRENAPLPRAAVEENVKQLLDSWYGEEPNGNEEKQTTITQRPEDRRDAPQEPGAQD